MMFVIIIIKYIFCEKKKSILLVNLLIRRICKIAQTTTKDAMSQGQLRQSCMLVSWAFFLVPSLLPLCVRFPLLHIAHPGKLFFQYTKLRVVRRFKATIFNK